MRERLRALDAERFPRHAGDPNTAVPYGQGLALTGDDPSALLDAIRRRASLHALVDPRVTIRGLPLDDPAHRDVAFDMLCEVHQHTHAVFLRFA